MLEQRRVARSAFSVLAAAWFLLPFFSPCPSPAADTPTPQVLRIGIVPMYTPDKIHQLYMPLVDYLNRNTPYLWELSLGDTHDELVDHLCRGEVSIAFLGPIPFGKAVRRCANRPLLITLGSDGSPHYHSVLVTTDPAVQSVKDLRGKTFALFEKSTAAYYLPLRMLADEGISRADVIQLPVSSQDRIVSSVLSNQASGGGIKESLYLKFRDRLRLLKTSEAIPSFVFCASPGLPAEAEKAFTTALLKLKPLSRDADRETVKDWDSEIAYGFILPPEDFSKEVLQLLASVESYLK